MASIVLAALVAGCSVGGKFVGPAVPTDHAWRDPPSVTAPRRPDWWRALGDPVLDSLVDQAMQASPDLQTAATKIVQARAQGRISAAARLPQLSGTGGLNVYRIPPELAARIDDIDPAILRDSLNLQASWELDFWGKNRAAARADAESYLASQAAYDAALVSLLGDLASAYVDLRIIQARRGFAQDIADADTRLATIAAARRREGLTSGQDPAQAAATAAQARAEVAGLDRDARQQANAVALLAGASFAEVADMLAAIAPVPRPPAAPDVGVPRDLLRNRPDVRQAEFNARAQFEKLISAKASRYPSFSLGGTLGFSATNIGDSSLLDIFSWDKRSVQGALSFTVPLFDQGRIVAQIRVQDAATEQALLAYEKSVAVAQRDVGDALVQLDTATRSATALVDAVRLNAISERIAAARYRDGASDRQSLVNAQLATLSLADALVQAEGATTLSFIALNRALGLGPRAPDRSDPLSPRVRARMTARTDWGRILPAKPAPPPPEPRR